MYCSQPLELENGGPLEIVLREYDGQQNLFNRPNTGSPNRTREQELAEALRPYMSAPSQLPSAYSQPSSQLPPRTSERQERWENPLHPDFAHEFLLEVIGDGSWEQIQRNLKRIVRINSGAVVEFSLLLPREVAAETERRPIKGKTYNRNFIDRIQDEAAEEVYKYI